MHLLAGVAVVCLAAQSATALTPATLLTPELETQQVNLAGLSGGTLSYFDDERRLTRAAAEGFVRLSLADETPLAGEASPNGMIDLVDGQRLAGEWTGVARDGEAIVWMHPTLGRFTLGLDDVRRVTIAGGELSQELDDALDAGTAEGDTVRLRNGDQFVGFIVSVADDAVTIQPDDADSEVTLLLETVASVTLANPRTPPGEVVVAGDLVALVDGSRVRGGAVSIERETLRLTPTLTDAMSPVELGLVEVRQIDFASAGLRLIELGERPMRMVAGGSAFGLEFWPTVDETGIRLHAPVTVLFDLPEGVLRFAAKASLDLPAGLPADRAAWADLEFSVTTGAASEAVATNDGPELMRLRASEPEAQLNLTLDGPRQLRIDVDPAANGPVLDRLLLRDAVLLVEVPDPQPGSGDANP